MQLIFRTFTQRNLYNPVYKTEMYIFQSDKKRILHSIYLCMIVLICFDTCFFELVRYFHQDSTQQTKICYMQESVSEEQANLLEWSDPEYRTRNIQIQFSDSLFTTDNPYNPIRIYINRQCIKTQSGSEQKNPQKTCRTHLVLCTLLI